MNFKYSAVKSNLDLTYGHTPGLKYSFETNISVRLKFNNRLQNKY